MIQLSKVRLLCINCTAQIINTKRLYILSNT